MRSTARPSLPATQDDDCSFLSPIKKSKSSFKCSNSHARLQLPEDLVTEILIRLPAKSVARFRCVSTTWLSIATDHSCILAHARRASKTLLAHLFFLKKSQLLLFCNQLLSFSVSGLSRVQLSFDHISDVARSSCNGLVLLWGDNKRCSSCEYYVMNPLTGLIIDIPNPNESNNNGSKLELYYHRWTGEHRILNIRNFKELISSNSMHLDAAVLSLAGGCPSPLWRQIKAKVPIVFLSYSLMELPSNDRKALSSFSDGFCSNFGLVNIEGNLCFWVVHSDKSCMKNFTIHVWAAVDGDEKWKNTYSLCFKDEWLWDFIYKYNARFFIVCCLCVRETELLFFIYGLCSIMKNARMVEHALQYLFHWDFKSGKYWKEPLPARHCGMMSTGIVHKETLVTTPYCSTAAATHVLL